ncbi:SPOSA6832_01301 [Sporobolomyces salmonicolor]|uniref:SPOSA6832_01301-mRNA-1:cds n=1 Tax=Sporidiobolus salmonicolor TaxID=5005 RepID=A0A0D6EIG6_SPOSA|nr:SPOSA6832_01301 [Sporobolomyces salmonicolor]
MASSIIEDSRALAEDADLFERSLSSLLLSLQAPVSTHRDRLGTSHRASDLLNRIVHRSDALYAALQPSNDDRTREIDALTGQAAGGDLAEFYQRLANVKDYHRKYPGSGTVRISGDRDVDFAALEGADPEWLDKKFTGEEGLGRYLDLHELHEQWNNLAPTSTSGAASAGGWKRLTYLQYLASITSFTLSLQLKSSPEYSKYLTALLSYLSGFYERVLPLGDLDEVLKAADEAFAKQWEAGQVQGWTQEQAEEDGEKKASEGICLYSVYTAHLTGKKHIKAAAKLAGDGADPSASSSAPTSAALAALRHQKNRALALKEALITSLLASYPSSAPAGPLAEILADTLANTERRAALTDKERAAEIEELEAREAAEAAAAAAAAQVKKTDASGEVEDEDDEGRIYNPLKLPLGWDGKPIPYWLYKLHGLGVEYKCEICSDHVYQGRKNFERHFQESRHAFGMRALGLPNTKHFHEITRIEDAIACASFPSRPRRRRSVSDQGFWRCAVAEKLKQEGRQELSQAELTEELEDDEGNVYNRKTYEDLKRQGLV